MSDTPLLRLARLMLRFVGNESSNDPDSLNLHAALFDLVRDLEAAPSPAPERRTITRAEWLAFLAALDRYAGHYGDRSGAEDEALARAILSSPLRLTVEDA